MDFFKKTIGQMLETIGAEPEEKMGLIGEYGKYSWQDINNITNAICKEMIDLGIQKGDQVGIIGVNSESWVFHYFATVKLGAVAVLLNTRFTTGEIQRCIELSGIKNIFYGANFEGESYEKMLRGLLYPNSTLRHCSFMEKTFEQWQKIKAEGKEIHINPFTDPDGVASILFTSGTTGNSKGVQLTHHNLLSNSLEMIHKMNWNEKDIMCVAVPLFHTFGITACILASLQGSFQMTLLKSTRTLDICQKIEEYKCTIMNGVPTMFLAMLRNEARNKYDLTSLKSGIIAGSQIFPQDYRDICQMFEGINLQPSYGQTETSPCVTICDIDDAIDVKANTVGKPIEGVEIRIMKKGENTPAGRNVEGEIQVKGPNVMLGYASNSEETKEVFTTDGWLKTGDLGYIREDDNLVITGRFKNLIIRGGENISPVEIERAIKGIIGQREVKVLGVPTIVLQEEIVACIEGKGDEKLKQEIMNSLKDKISDYKIPKYLFFIEDMPRNSTGKINESVLKNKILSELTHR